MKFSRKSVLACAAAGWCIVHPSAAFAQATNDTEAESGAEEDRGRIQTILVTARKTEEDLSDVPISVTAIGREEILAANLEDIRDVAAFTPGLVIEGFNSIPGRFDSTPFIRGVVFDSTDPLRQTVSVFVDGVFVSGGNQALSLDDIERVEVIKGPQSAQYGRSTFAGAINYITRDPSADFGGNVSILAATRNEYEVRGFVEGGLIGDVVTARVGGRYSFNDGHYRNNLDTSQRLGEEETWNVNGTILIEPSTSFRAKIRAFYSEIDDGHPATPLIDSSFNRGPFVPGGETFFVGTLPTFDEANLGFNSTDADFDTFIADAEMRGVSFIITPKRFGLQRDTFRISFDAQADLTDNVSLAFLAGYSEEQATTLVDTDQTPDRAYTLYAGRDFEDFQAEGRLFGTAFNDVLDWSIGANFYKLDFITNGAFGLQAFDQSSSFGDLGEFDFEFVETFGVFGRAGINVSDTITLTLEGRYQEDRIDEKVGGGNSTDSVTGSPTTFKNFLPRVILDYQPTPDSLFYASYSEGNLAGGFNSNFFDLSPEQVTALNDQFPGLSGTFEEETLVNYEVGWKQSVGSIMNFALAVYFMERTDQGTNAVAQLPNPDFATDPTAPPIVTETFFVNAAASEIFGIELESNFYPTDGLSFRGTIAYTEAKISGFPASGDSGDFEDVFLTDEGFIGQRAERYPDIQATFSGTYETAINSDDLRWYVRGDVLYASEYFLSTPNLGKAPQVVDGRLRTGFRTDTLTIEAFVTNLFNERAPTAGNNYIDLSNQTPLFSFGVDATSIGLRDKRQFGLRGIFNF